MDPKKMALVAALMAAGVPDEKIPAAVRALRSQVVPQTVEEFVAQVRSAAEVVTR